MANELKTSIFLILKETAAHQIHVKMVEFVQLKDQMAMEWAEA